MTAEQHKWFVSDLTRPDSENPVFGPMTEKEAIALAKSNPSYWAHRIRSH